MERTRVQFNCSWAFVRTLTLIAVFLSSRPTASTQRWRSSNNCIPRRKRNNCCFHLPCELLSVSEPLKGVNHIHRAVFISCKPILRPMNDVSITFAGGGMLSPRLYSDHELHISWTRDETESEEVGTVYCCWVWGNVRCFTNQQRLRMSTDSN